MSPESHDLHRITFYICWVICMIVFGAILYSLIQFRKSKGPEASHFHKNLGVEMIWTTIPFVILVILAIPATFYIHQTDESTIQQFPLSKEFHKNQN
jgi:cytochrome c oxidase subunit II